MKKSQANNILENQTKRRNVLLSLIFIIIIVSIITLSFFLMYFNKNKKQYINYNEKSNVDYNVFLKDNDFFEDKYLRKGNQYIASLIDYINVDFNYRILYILFCKFYCNLSCIFCNSYFCIIICYNTLNWAYIFFYFFYIIFCYTYNSFFFYSVCFIFWYIN